MLNQMEYHLSILHFKVYDRSKKYLSCHHVHC